MHIIRKNGGESIIYHNIIEIQKGKYDVTGPRLLYYYKKMPYIVLGNIYILLRIVNGVTKIVYRVISLPDSMLTVSR